MEAVRYSARVILKGERASRRVRKQRSRDRRKRRHVQSESLVQNARKGFFRLCIFSGSMQDRACGVDKSGSSDEGSVQIEMKAGPINKNYQSPGKRGQGGTLGQRRAEGALGSHLHDGRGGVFGETDCIRRSRDGGRVVPTRDKVTA